jgi:protein-S-isoprenylcysteine O-methyltransferase Ste14
MSQTGSVLVRIAIFTGVAVFLFWIWLSAFPPVGNALCIGSVVAIFPAVFAARRMLDRNPSVVRTIWITTALHAVLILCFGMALIKALQTYASWRGFRLPVSLAVGEGLVLLTGAAAFVTVANLALRGLGAPFAIALSRRLETRWLYRWTRNPMVLATISWFVSIGVLLQSAGFVAWVLLLVVPAELTFLKVYEERELEIRFGDSYRVYKAKTAFLWPRPPSEP